MTSARWIDLEDDLASARQHFGSAVQAYRSMPMTELSTYWNRMAFQHAMYAGYTSFESFLRRLLTTLDEPLPVGPDWHAKLLSRTARPVEGHRPALIGTALHDAALHLLKFRHVALHSYETFDPELAEPAVRADERFLALIDQDAQMLRAMLDPDEQEPQ